MASHGVVTTAPVFGQTHGARIPGDCPNCKVLNQIKFAIDLL